MEYIRQEQDKLIKYDVTYSVDDLEAIRYEIIKNCGIRKHVSYKTSHPELDPLLRDRLLYENYNEVAVGKQEYFEETVTLYQIDFDSIKEPMLSVLIDGLIRKADLSILDYLYGYKQIEDEENDKLLLNQKFSTLKRMIDGNIDYNKVRGLLDEMQRIDDQNNYNESLNLKNQKEYLDSVRRAIVLTKIDEIDYDSYARTMSFVKTKKRK